MHQNYNVPTGDQTTTSEAQVGAYAPWGAAQFSSQTTYSPDLMYPFQSQNPAQYYPATTPYGNTALTPAVQTGGPSQNSTEQSWKFQVLWKINDKKTNQWNCVFVHLTVQKLVSSNLTTMLTGFKFLFINRLFTD